MIELKHLTKSYNGKVVVDDVSIDLPKKKIISFIGPNGAGKSTLLSMMSRLIPMDQGDVVIEGKSIKDWDTSALSRKIAILKQSNHLDIRLTIKELVSFGRFPYSKGNLRPEDQEHIDKAIAYMQLKEIENKFLDELSGGQRQRAYIAMVIAQNTEYILLDEPLNNLDMKHAVEIMKTLRGLVEDLGKTVIIVIHDINFASCYSDIIVAMNGGCVVESGSTNHIINETLLSHIYDMRFNINEINAQRICVYY